MTVSFSLEQQNALRTSHKVPDIFCQILNKVRYSE
jgi:hypothetical protein